MAEEEFDVFAKVARRDERKPAAEAPSAATGEAPAAGSAAPREKQPRKFQKGRQSVQQTGRQRGRGGNSPLRGANGEESVNPLLNAPLPSEQ